MTRIHLLILWVLTLIAGAILINVKGSKHQTPQESTALSQGDTVLNADQLRTSSGLRVSKGNETSSLILNEKDWVVSEQENFPVNIESLSSAFDTLRKLKITQGLPAGPEAWERFGLDESAAKEADQPKVLTLLAEDGSDDLTIYIGKQRESGSGQGSRGRFVRFSGDDSSVYIVDEGFDEIRTDSSNWINKSLPKIEAPLRVSVKRESGEEWTVARKTAIGDMLLLNLPEGMETVVAQTAPLKTIFANSTFTELLNEEEVNKRKATGEGREVTIEAASGMTYLYSLVPELKDDTEEKEEGSDSPQPDNRNYMISLKITSGPKAPEVPAADASEEDKAAYQALLANMKNAEKKYAQDKKFEGRYFLVPNFVVNALTKQASELQQKIKPKPETPNPTPNAGLPNGDTPTTPPVKAPDFIPGGPNNPQPANGKKPRKRIEAVTPPIAIPQLPKKENVKPEESKPEGDKK